MGWEGGARCLPAQRSHATSAAHSLVSSSWPCILVCLANHGTGTAMQSPVANGCSRSCTREQHKT
eukprot:scaffold3029_cov33-Tisochrysis_lutea.AAC.5